MTDATVHKVKKPPPLKKRHTKPCRYFQVYNCPKSAEECDFAHVIAPTPITPSSKACRYYLAGKCTNGMWCRFLHPVNPTEELGLSGATLSNITEADVRYPYKHMLDGPSPSFSYPFYSAAPISPYQATYTGQGIPPSMWSPTFHYPDAQLRLPSYMSPASSAGQADDEEEQRGREYSNPIVISSSSGVISPTLCSPSQTHSPQPRKYKTKMCKFAQAGRQCPSGDSCTLNSSSLHEQDRLTGPRQLEDMRHQLPSKPLSMTEESMKRGYFPVSWRVIGGGVRIGGSSDSTNISLAYEDDLDSDKTDDEFHYVETVHPTPISLPTQSEFASLINSADTKSEFGSESDQLEERPIIPTRVTPRARANSIPNTPTVAHLQTRFSAES
ncbi:hypothetical protein CPB85DRAFT_1254721 [Mucidula mucida]|nr:hypothetical protein CPB85DRAFT_1254721 [Mucidula mucida]